MANQAAQTAYGPMITAAVEQYFPAGQRLVQDDLAIQLLPPVYKTLVKLTRWPPLRTWIIKLIEKRASGVWGGVLCRKRYIDDKLLEAIQAGIQTVVILGAGLDTRAYRPPLMGSLSVFEVDLPENIAFKKARVQEMFGEVPPHARLVALDFDRGELGDVLTLVGYYPEDKSFFIWEAVTQYLGETGIHKTMKLLSEAASGSRLVFTYICKDFIDGRDKHGLDKVYEVYRVKRPIWRFGLEPEGVDDFLRQYGWRELEQAGVQEYTSRYLKPAGRPMPVMDIERAVYAQKM